MHDSELAQHKDRQKTFLSTCSQEEKQFFRILQDSGRPENRSKKPSELYEWMINQIEEKILARDLPLPSVDSVEEIFSIASGSHQHFIPILTPENGDERGRGEAVRNAELLLSKYKEYFMEEYRKYLVERSRQQ